MKTPKLKIARRWARFCRCESGATVIEYGLIAVLISIVAITAMRSSGNSIGGNFNTMSNAVSDAVKG